MPYITLIISLLALLISAYTFWANRIKKGKVKMTRPTVIFFGPDGIGKEDKKVFIRTLLYSTSDKGKYIQNMFVRLQHSEAVQNFNVWVYDDRGLVRGSGLFISKTGLSANHHFLMPKDGTPYDFSAGTYLLQVFVETVNENPVKIFEQTLVITSEQQGKLLEQNLGLYFDWVPNTQNYFAHIDKPTRKQDELVGLIDKLTTNQ